MEKKEEEDGKEEEEEEEEIQEIEQKCDEIDQIGFTQKLSIDDNDDDDDEVVIIGTKGPVALRDFPHPRDLCANFPFDSTPHELYCSKCYCVSCEVIAPCSQWKRDKENNGHCSISKKCKDKSERSYSSEEKKISIIKTEPGN